MNYKSLEIYQLADELVVEIHEMTLIDLPGFEMYETGSQIRRSIKSVKSNIVEGYGRRYQLNLLGRKLNAFISSVRKSHLTNNYNL